MNFLKISGWVLAGAMILNAPVHADDADAKKPKAGKREGRAPILQTVLDHEKDLALTAEQKTKIEALMKESAEAREKAQSAPEVVKLRDEMKAARKAGDEEKVKSLRQQIQAIAGKGAGDVRQKVAEILSPDQMKKLAEFLPKGEKGERKKKGEDAPPPAAANPENKPTGTPPPLFEGEKKEEPKKE